MSYSQQHNYGPQYSEFPEYNPWLYPPPFFMPPQGYQTERREEGQGIGGCYMIKRRQDVQRKNKCVQTEEKNEVVEKQVKIEAEIQKLNIIGFQQSYEIKLNLIQMLKLYENSVGQEYNDFYFKINEEEDNELVKNFYLVFHERITHFKKSKEQILKYIIRKTQRRYKYKYNCKKDERFIKYGRHKSMNTSYLKDMFSDDKFVECFEEVSEIILGDFKEENDSKLNAIIQAFGDGSQKSFKRATNFLFQKNKMPWPKVWRKKMLMVFQGIFKDYVYNPSEDSKFAVEELKIYMDGNDL